MSDEGLKAALAKIDDSVTVPTVPDNPDVDVQNVLEGERRSYATELHDQHLAERKEAMGQRKIYAKRVFALVCLWIVAIFLLLVFQVFGQAFTNHYHPLGDGVLIALISSTTVNLIGTLIIVLNYIFHIPNLASSPASSPEQ